MAHSPVLLPLLTLRLPSGGAVSRAAAAAAASSRAAPVRARAAAGDACRAARLRSAAVRVRLRLLSCAGRRRSWHLEWAECARLCSFCSSPWTRGCTAAMCRQLGVFFLAYASNLLLLLGCICCSATQVLRAYAAPADEQRFAPVLLLAVYLKRPLDVPAAAASLARTPHLHPCVFGTWRWIASLRWTLFVVNSAIAWLQHLRMAKSDSRQPRCLL